MDNDKPKKKKSKVLLIIIIMICAGVLAFSAYQLISMWLKYRKGQEEYDKIREYTYEKPDTSATPTPEVTPVPNLYPDAPIEIDTASLLAINPDFIGWLYFPAEDISYPVTHTTDNEYYLHTGFEGDYVFAGCLFTDCLNNPGFDDPHTIIYVHNMNDTSSSDV